MNMDRYKAGNEFLPYHPQASHCTPAYRDGWNHCYEAAQGVIVGLRLELERLKAAATVAQPRQTYIADMEDTLRQIATACGLDPNKPNADLLIKTVQTIARVAHGMPAAATAAQPQPDPLRKAAAEALEAMAAGATGEQEPKRLLPLTTCAANRDGECSHPGCPQNRDGEPVKSGRHCPLDTASDE